MHRAPLRVPPLLLVMEVGLLEVLGVCVVGALCGCVVYLLLRKWLRGEETEDL